MPVANPAPALGYTVKETSAQECLRLHTVYDLIKYGLPAVNIGGRLVLTPDSIARLHALKMEAA